MQFKIVVFMIFSLGAIQLPAQSYINFHFKDHHKATRSIPLAKIASALLAPPYNFLCISYTDQNQGTYFIPFVEIESIDFSDSPIVPANGYIDPFTGKYLECSAAGPACPAGYVCKFNYDRYYCIKASSSTNPEIPNAYIDPSTGQYLECSQPGATCPMGYTCQFNINKYYCISHPQPIYVSVVDQAKDEVFYLIGGLPIRCPEWPHPELCPTGYTCKFIIDNYYCVKVK